MNQIAFVRGKYDDKDSEEVVPGVFVGGEIQKKVQEFGKKFKVVDVKPWAPGVAMIIYEDRPN